MPYSVSKSIVFVGMMGAGKSAIGRTLAERLSLPFVDSDGAIEAAANLKISEIFEKFGEPFFREKEMQVVRRLVEGDLQVLATGGGAYSQAETRTIIDNAALSVWLNADLETIWNRVKGKTHRPLLQTENPRKVLEDMMEKRLPDYQNAAVHITVDAENSIDDTTDLVIKQLLEQGVIKEVLT